MSKKFITFLNSNELFASKELFMGKTAKVTSKGQVTIPKEIRAILDSEVVEFIVEDERVVLRPIKRVAGRLSSYADVVRIQKESSAWRNSVRDTREDR